MNDSANTIPDEPIDRTVISSGIRVVSQRVPCVRSVALGVWVEVGSRDEPSELEGACHFLEHMHFKGTERRSAQDVARSLESVGGSLNAYTGREYTVYTARFLPDHLPLAVDVIADVLGHSKYLAEDVSRERTVIEKEIRDVEDAPSDAVFDLFDESLWDGHPLAHPVLGYRRTVRTMPGDELLAFKERTHVGSRMVIAAAGEVDHARLVDVVGTAFEWMRDTLRPVDRTPPYFAAKRRASLRSSKLVHLVCGVEGLSSVHPDRTALVLLNTALGDGMSSRLFQSVRENMGLAYSVYSFIEAYSDCGIWGAYAGCDPRKVREASEALVREFASLARDGLTDDELLSAKEQIRGSVLLSQESPVGRANRIARYELDRRPFETVDETLARYAAVSRDDTVRVARRLIPRDRVACASIGARVPLASTWRRLHR